MKRWFVTYIDRHGLRVVLGSWRGRDRAGAESLAQAIEENNAPSQLASVYGPQAAGTFEAREVECWESGDPKRVYLTDEEGEPL